MSESCEIIIPWPEPSGTRIIECVEVKVHTGYIWARLESGHSIRIENPQNVIISYPKAEDKDVSSTKQAVTTHTIKQSASDFLHDSFQP